MHAYMIHYCAGIRVPVYTAIKSPIWFQGYTPSLIVSDFKTTVSLCVSLIVLMGFLIFVAYTTYVWIAASVGQSGKSTSQPPCRHRPLHFNQNTDFVTEYTLEHNQQIQLLPDTLLAEPKVQLPLPQVTKVIHIQSAT